MSFLPNQTPPSSSSPSVSTKLNMMKALYSENRAKLVQALQNSNSTIPRSSLVFLQGGPSETRFDSDHEPLFRQESYFCYLSGVVEPDCALCIQVNSGYTTLFIPKLPAEYATIMGHIQTPEEWRAKYQVDHVEYTENIEDYLLNCLLDEKQSSSEKLASNGVCNGNITHGVSVTNGDNPAHANNHLSNKQDEPLLLLLEGPNSDSGKTYEAPTLNSPKLDRYADKNILFPILAECRVCKSPAELHVLQEITEISSMAHVYTMKHTKPGMYEYQSESLFRHYCLYNHQARLVGYTPICGCGPNAAVLHYGHAGEPNARQLREEDICLYDMGAESIYFYGSDVTCSFPARGSFSQKQKQIYEAVLDAQRAVYDLLQPGVSWVTCHEAAEAAILQHLVDIGLVYLHDKSILDLVELRLGAVFMPHGLGHFIGIDTHDVGGYLEGHPARSPAPGLRSLRTARVIKKDMVLTVEPGCYFINHLLDQALEGPLRQHLNVDLLETFRGFGGVRLEDVVAITEDGIVNYTLCPRTVSEVEHVMAGHKWPPVKDEAPELRRIRLCDPGLLPPLAPPSAEL